jgi:peptidoglycan glycosyltransferase
MKDNNKNDIRFNFKIILYIYISLFIALVFFLGYSVITDGESWYGTIYNPRIQQKTAPVNMGTVYDTNMTPIAWTENGLRKYSSSDMERYSVAHVLGDTAGMTIGAQVRFGRYLYGKAQKVSDKVEEFLSGTAGKGSDIVLTIDSELSRYAFDLLAEKRGAIVLINYRTGEVLIDVSSPSFDPLNPVLDETEESGFVDRSTMGRYPPGSVMKIVTACAAIDSGIDMRYECTGSVDIGGTTISCPGGKAHGMQDMSEAFAASCNTYFAVLAQKIGKEAMLKTAGDFRYNHDFDFSDFSVYRSSFDTEGSDSDFSWACVGQYKDLITPMHIALITSSIANSGYMPEPKLLKTVLTNGKSSYRDSYDQYARCTGAGTAERISEFMRKVVDEGTGTACQVSGAVICGKTGTAEYIYNGEISNHSLFTGFIDDDENPYAIAVIVEGAGFGSQYAAPIAQRIFDRILNG